MPKYLETLLSHGHLTGWDPGWYDGFPLYTLLHHPGSVHRRRWVDHPLWRSLHKSDTVVRVGVAPDLHVGLWPLFPVASSRSPAILAAATLPFLFDYTFTIYGGNLFSTLAGEYAFSFSLSLAVLFLGLFACAVREGRYHGVGSSGAGGVRTVPHRAGHVRAGGAVILTIVELLPARWGIGDAALRVRHGNRAVEPVPGSRTLWWAASTVGVGLLLSGWWLVPFGLEHALSTSMGYTNVEGWAQYFREADTWALVLAGIGAIAASQQQNAVQVT